MVTKDEFIERFKHAMAGIALFGAATDEKGGIFEKTKLALEIPGKIEKWLSSMYEFMAASIPLEPLKIQGSQPAQQQQPRKAA